MTRSAWAAKVARLVERAARWGGGTLGAPEAFTQHACRRWLPGLELIQCAAMLEAFAADLVAGSIRPRATAAPPADTPAPH